MFMPGHTELIVIALVVFLIFGAKRLPEIGKGLGGAIREFKNVKKHMGDETTPGEADAPESASAASTSTQALEDKITGKVIGQMPGLKTAVDMKKKAEKISSVLK
ncbi:MAG TPA: twin-arginine translocase TatA/TatE family subunit [Desulfobacteraceae bacterium]|jgi:sec-independent protein translocase protein TatA|nr:twin-arginine translocase TatA/TatE family subunit [Desulfobacteraceae bacterium]